MKVLVFADSKLFMNVTSENNEGNLYIQFGKGDWSFLTTRQGQKTITRLVLWSN